MTDLKQRADEYERIRAKATGSTWPTLANSMFAQHALKSTIVRDQQAALEEERQHVKNLKTCIEMGATESEEFQAEIERLTLLVYSPLGDNHHNANSCPYCTTERNEEKEQLEAKIKTLRKERDYYENIHDREEEDIHASLSKLADAIGKPLTKRNYPELAGCCTPSDPVRAVCAAAVKEIESLKAWKEQAIAMLLRVDAIADAIPNQKLGSSKIDNIAAEIERLKASIDELREELEDRDTADWERSEQ